MSTKADYLIFVNFKSWQVQYSNGNGKQQQLGSWEKPESLEHHSENENDSQMFCSKWAETCINIGGTLPASRLFHSQTFLYIWPVHLWLGLIKLYWRSSCFHSCESFFGKYLQFPYKNVLVTRTEVRPPTSKSFLLLHKVNQWPSTGLSLLPYFLKPQPSCHTFSHLEADKYISHFVFAPICISLSS